MPENKGLILLTDEERKRWEDYVKQYLNTIEEGKKYRRLPLSERIKVLKEYFIYPDNWGKTMKECAEELGWGYDAVQKSIQAYGSKKFWEEVELQRTKRLAELGGFEKIASEYIQRGVILLLHRINRELNDPNGRWTKAGWHLVNLIKAIYGEKIIQSGNVTHEIKIIKEVVDKNYDKLEAVATEIENESENPI